MCRSLKKVVDEEHFLRNRRTVVHEFKVNRGDSVGNLFCIFIIFKDILIFFMKFIQRERINLWVSFANKVDYLKWTIKFRSIAVCHENEHLHCDDSVEVSNSFFVFEAKLVFNVSLYTFIRLQRLLKAFLIALILSLDPLHLSTFI